MAQTVVVAGATYPDVPSVELPKSGGGTAAFMDTSDATASAADIASGKTAYAGGVLVTGTNEGGDNMYYGVCSTAAATAAKVVTISGITALTEGLSIRVKFSNAQTASAPTLNVNALGAKNIKRYGTTNAAAYEWVAGEVIDLVYDGTYWIIADGGLATTTYYGVTKLSSSTSSTSTALAATPSAVKAAYDLAASKASFTMLWENASPSSAFAAQTISISGLSNYDLIWIEFYTTVNSDYDGSYRYMRKHELISYASDAKGELTAAFQYDSDKWCFYRSFEFSGNKIVFALGYDDGTGDNDSAVPIRVVGIKL